MCGLQKCYFPFSKTIAPKESRDTCLMGLRYNEVQLPKIHLTICSWRGSHGKVEFSGESLLFFSLELSQPKSAAYR